jgi:beta-galactosidase
VPYEAGELRVIAYRGGTIVAEDVRVTSKDARRLALRLENEDVRANGEDIAIFTCYVTDEDGNEVYDATPTVSFSTDHSGEIYSTGSDITDHSSIFLPVRRMRAGRISVAVKPTGYSGELRLRAESDELESAEISVKLKTE